MRLDIARVCEALKTIKPFPLLASLDQPRRRAAARVSETVSAS
ncbi:MAG: hypothetical protein ACI9YM_001201 [Brevundimonas sp.]|jgi:hypothetical protein